MAATGPILAGLVFSGDLLAAEDDEGGDYNENGNRLVPGLKTMGAAAPATAPTGASGDGGQQ